MSAKKEAKPAPAKAAVVVKKSKVDQATKIKRDSTGKKIMKVARGSARAARRVDLKANWRNVANAKKMQPAANNGVAEAAA